MVLLRRRALISAAAVFLGLALSGCTAATDPAPTSTPSEALFGASDGVSSSSNLFFSLLAAGEVDTTAVLTDPATDLDPAKPLSLLMSSEVYAQIEDRPKILSLDDVTASEDGQTGTAVVSYKLAGEKRTDTLELRLTSTPENGPAKYAIVVPKEKFGLDATGVELLPANTVYRINGVDVSAAFQEARGRVSNGAVPRIPAFGGTYPLEITVPGDNGFTDVLELRTSTFYGGDGTDGKLAEFAHAHGF